MNDISVWRFPLSLVLALLFVTGGFLLWRYLPDGRLRRILTGRAFGAIAISLLALMTAVEGTWGIPLHRSPLLWGAAMLMMFSLEMAIPGNLQGGRVSSALVSHAGMLLLVSGAFWGAPDFVDAQMTVTGDEAGNVAYSAEGRAVTLPFNTRLENFTIDFYYDGISPKQYVSTLDIDGRQLVTSVNHPCRYRGYRIYQYGYDSENGEYAVLKLVRDPWLTMVYAGMLLLATGAFMRLRLDWNSRWLGIALVVTAVLFTAISVARINFGTLVPALRSWWFVPHLVMYMIAYSSLALALISGVLSLSLVHSERFGTRAERFGVLSCKLSDTASSLLLLGMLCGAVWAKQAWGDWWTWDTKECWAAVTWLATLMGQHIPSRNRNVAVFVFIVISFIAMQVAWYGVDILPAADASLHTYR